MKKCLYILLTLIVLAPAANAQQDPLYSQYMFNSLVLNPAYAGSREQMSSTLIIREQWTSVNDGPSTQSFGIHAPTWDGQHGIGLTVVNDRVGFSSNFMANAAYAYNIELSGDANLRLGLNLGLDHYKVNSNEVRTHTQGDVAFTGQEFSRWHAIAGTGVYFNTETFYMGASVPNLLPNTLYDTYYEELIAKRSRHIFVTSGAIFETGTDIKLRPSFLVKATEGAPLSVDLNLHALYRDAFWFGVSFRPSSAFVLMAEYNVTNNLRIGYAFDATLGRLQGYTGGSHEFMIGMDFGFTKEKMATPRFF